MEPYLLGVGLYLATGIVSLLVGERAKSGVVLAGALPATLLLVVAAIRVMTGETARLSIVLGYPIGAASFVLDPLSALFVVVIAVGGLASLVYAGGYLRSYLGTGRTIGSHWFFLVLLVVSMLLVVVIRHAILFLIAWELMSLSSFFLVLFENEKREVQRAALNYLITMHVGLFFLVAAFVLLSLKAGSFDLDRFGRAVGAPESVPLFFLLFLGFGIKAGFIPLHSWLPLAHPAAPSHVSGLMSGVMIKMGIYGILRFILLFGALPAEAGYAVLAVSLLSAVLGVIYAIAQHDLKTLLAYHSVENIGIIGIGIGFGLLGMAYRNEGVALLGFGGALFHMINHSIFKGLLFYGAGAVYLGTHSRMIDRLGGLARRMGITAALFLVGCLAICGLPPFNGFVSEFVLYLGMLHGFGLGNTFATVVSVFSVTALALVGSLAVLCFTKVYGVAFLGSPRSAEAERAHEADWRMLLPMGFLALLCLGLGLFPQTVLPSIARAAAELSGYSAGAAGAFLGTGLASLVSILRVISILFLALLGTVGLLAGVRALLLRRRTVGRTDTWACGYRPVGPRMQYTASSYARPFLELVSPLFKEHGRPTEVRALFPLAAESSTHSEELLDAYVTKPVVNALRAAVKRFTWIQSGNLQQYMLYGLLFLLVTVVWVLGTAR